MKQILDALPQTPIVSGATTSRIPIWFFHLRATNGNSIHVNYDIEAVLDVVNQQFDGVFEFTVCGNTTIDNDQFNVMDVSASSTDFADLSAYVNALYQPTINHCIKVFLCDGIGSGVGGFAFPRYTFGENAAVFIVRENPNNLSHELGHYFGLPHTFIDPSTQYVHDINTPILVNGNLLTCQQTGDGFCDTPADLESDCNIIDCLLPASCTILDPLGVPYSPDPTLIMSYYADCANRFSLEQNIRMLTLFDLHPAYEPLRNPPAPCQISKGRIQIACANNVQFPTPLAELPVLLKDALSQCNNEKTNSTGRYDINPCGLLPLKRAVMPELEDYSNPLNGVTPFDLVLINKHILGIEQLDSPFKMIAADANNSGHISTVDVITIRKVILGSGVFPYASWRYIPSLCLGTQSFRDDFFDGVPFDAVFPDPFQGFPRTYLPTPPPYPSGASGSTDLPNNTMWMDHVNVVPSDPLASLENTWSFTAVKVGDVNCSVDVVTENIESEKPDVLLETDSELAINMTPNIEKIVAVIAESEKQIAAWQFGLAFPDSLIQIESILPGDFSIAFDLENFLLINDTTPLNNSALKSIWYSQTGNSVDVNNKVLFNLNIKANVTIVSLEEILKLSPKVLDTKFFDEFGNEVPTKLKLDLNSEEFFVNWQSSPSVNEIEKSKPLKDIRVYPNPTSNIVNFSFLLENDGNVRIVIYDSTGRIIVDNFESLVAGNHVFSFPQNKLPESGLLFYAIEMEGGGYQGKIVKQKNN